MLTVWNDKRETFKHAAKNSAKLSQIWNGIFAKRVEQTPSIGEHYTVRACKDKHTNQKAAYTNVRNASSGAARPAWANTKLWTVCEDVFGGDPAVDVTNTIDDDGEVEDGNETVGSGNLLASLCFDQLV